MKDLEQQLRSKLRGEFSSLAIEFNNHACNYCSVAEAVGERDLYDFGTWASEDEKQKAIATDSVWSIHWYPLTPVGFRCILASSLEVAMAAFMAAK